VIDLKVDRQINGRPYKLSMSREDQDTLETAFLQFLKTPATHEQCRAYLIEERFTDERLAAALVVTLWANLFGRRKLVDSTFLKGERPMKLFTTQAGADYINANPLGKSAKETR
jgi:hypothetical protein